MFSNAGLSSLWNEMALDGELSAWPEMTSSASPSCDDTNLSSVDNNVTLPSQSSFYTHKFSSTPHTQSVINSWTWSEQPTTEQLSSCLETLVTEQSQLVTGAAGSSLSSGRLRQRLTVLQRYLTAVSRNTVKTEEAGVRRTETSSSGCKSSRPAPAPGERAAMGLARVGSRAALSFAFAFLRRAWRSGEDQDLCSDLLTESLEALQALPEASLFHSECVSKVWLDVVERASKFLRQVVCGGEDRAAAPLEDRHLALALLCELAVQRADLSQMLSLVMLLLQLWRLQGSTETDNRHSQAGSASAPLVPLLRRLDTVESEIRQDSFQPTACFLQYSECPEDEDCSIDLQQAAVVIMSHLDRLSSIHTRARPAGQLVSCWGELDLTAVTALSSMTWLDSRPVFISEGQIWVKNSSDTMIDISGMTERNSSPVEVVGTSSTLFVLSSSGEVWAGGLGEPLQLVTGLLGRVVVRLVAGTYHVAAVTETGQLYTWSEDCQVPGLVSGLTGHTVVEAACGVGCDPLTVVLTDAGFVYSWCGLGAGAVPKLVEALSGLGVTRVAAGGSYSVAVTRAGELHLWGQLGQEEYLSWPRLVQGLEGSVSAVSAGPSHLVLLTTEGQLYGWGSNENKQLGAQLPPYVASPRLLSARSGYTGVSCGQSYTAAWSSHLSVLLPTRHPFVIDICEQTFRLDHADNY